MLEILDVARSVMHVLHCSALYVVDLVKFRETAAGDQLRVFYETLSKDPNSLSNLDQVSQYFDLLIFFSHLG